MNREKNSTFLRLFVFLLTSTLLSGCASFSHTSDSWFAQDKAKHFFVGGILGAGSALALDEEDGEAWVVSMGLVFAIGAAKETYDQNVKGTYFSGKDMVWNLLGGAAGVLLVTEAK